MLFEPRQAGQVVEGVPGTYWLWGQFTSSDVSPGHERHQGQRLTLTQSRALR